MAGKNVVLDFRAEACGFHSLLDTAHLEALGVGVVASEGGVDGFEEGGHAVIAFRAGTVAPGGVAIGAGDVAVGAGGDADDDFSGVVHGMRLNESWEMMTLRGVSVMKVERRDMTKNRAAKNGCARRGRLAWPI